MIIIVQYMVQRAFIQQSGTRLLVIVLEGIPSINMLLLFFLLFFIGNFITC